MKYFLFFACILLFALSANGQSDWRLCGKSIPELRAATRKPLLVKDMVDFPTRFSSFKTAPRSYPAFPTHFSMAATKAWCYNDLALFCRLEVKLEKATRFPIKVRLGETQQVERMEGKLGDGLKQ